MPDLFQLPNGDLVRKGNAFEIEATVTTVEPAVIATDADGNQSIEKPPYIGKGKVSRYYPDNWLHLATGPMLAQAGIMALEEEPSADPKFFFSNPGPIKKGVVTQLVTPRDVEDIARVLTAEVKDMARGIILSRFSIEKQTTMQMRLASIERARTAGEKPEEQAELYGQIIAAQEWIEAVLEHGDALEAEIDKLKSAKAAETWYGKPWDWPEYEQ